MRAARDSHVPLKPRRRPPGPALVAVALLALAPALGAQATRPGSRPESRGAQNGARLVVLFVVDQLASDVLRSAWPHLGAAGFRRLAREGAFYPEAAYDHACSETGPGHASLATGASPSIHGIVANDWIDAATGGLVGCVADPGTRLLPGGGPGASAHRLLAPTLGDALRSAFGPAVRIASVSIKDRSAILPVGAAGDYVVWYDRKNGGFLTSSAFVREGADAGWLDRLNRVLPIDSFADWTWEKTGPPEAYADLGQDDDPAERSLDGSRVFPHAIKLAAAPSRAWFCEEVCASPAGLALVATAARFLITEARLGQDDVPDLLGISFSSNDLVGHLFGPDSHEVRDMTLRTDGLLALLLEELDRTVGKSRYHVILSADHGIGPIPEVVARRGLPAGRVNGDKVRRAMEAGLKDAYGEAPESRRWVARTLDGDVLLNRGLLGEKKIVLREAQDRAAQAASAVPGIAEAIATHQIFDGSLPPGPLHDLIRRAQMESRSVDVYLVPKAHWLFGGIASHGTPHDYDRRVPLFLSGPGIKAGFESRDAVSPTSAAATIALALGVAPPAKADHAAIGDALAR